MYFAASASLVLWWLLTHGYRKQLNCARSLAVLVVRGMTLGFTRKDPIWKSTVSQQTRDGNVQQAVQSHQLGLDLWKGHTEKRVHFLNTLTDSLNNAAGHADASLHLALQSALSAVHAVLPDVGQLYARRFQHGDIKGWKARRRRASHIR